MNRNSNLQKSIKKAFEEHKEPLHEAQWDRLSAALGDKPPKRKLFPWLFGLVIIVGLSIGLGYWLGNTNDNKVHMAQQEHSANVNNDDKSLSSDAARHPSTKQTETTDNSDNNNLTQQENDLNKATTDQSGQTGDKRSKVGKADPLSLSGQLAQADKGNKDGNVSGQDRQNGRTSGQDGKDVMGPEAANNGGQVAGTTGTNGTETTGAQNNTGTKGGVLNTKPAQTEVPDLIALGRKELIKIEDNTVYKKDNVAEIELPKDTTKKKTKGKDGDSEKTPVSRFAIGFTTGISRVEYKGVTFSDDSKMHEDTRHLSTQGNQQPASSFANLFFDVKVLKNLNLTFNSGIQYRQIQTFENITYKYNKVPFRDTNGVIFGYLFIDDTLNPQVFKHQSTHVTKFVSIPLTLGYTFPIGRMNEIQLNGGVVLNKVTAVKGSTFSLNDAEVLDLRSRVSPKISMGYAGGLNYFRCIYGSWWIGGGFQMQQNKTVFDTPYGKIKSNNQITNYTFNIKYKF